MMSKNVRVLLPRLVTTCMRRWRVNEAFGKIEVPLLFRKIYEIERLQASLHPPNNEEKLAVSLFVMIIIKP